MLVVTIFTHDDEVAKILLSLQHGSLRLAIHLDALQIFIVHQLLPLFDLAIQLLDLLLQTLCINDIGKSARAEIFTNHGVLIKQMLVALLNRVKFFLKLVDVLFLCHLHLAQDFFLSVEFTI